MGNTRSRHVFIFRTNALSTTSAQRNLNSNKHDAQTRAKTFSENEFYQRQYCRAQTISNTQTKQAEIVHVGLTASVGRRGTAGAGLSGLSGSFLFICKQSFSIP